LAAPGPRFIIIIRDGNRPNHENELEQLIWHAKSSSRSPAILFVNRESRTETLRSYSLLHYAIPHDDAVPDRTSLFHFEQQQTGRARPERYEDVHARVLEHRALASKEIRKSQVVYCDFTKDVIYIAARGAHDFLQQISVQDRERMAFLAIPDFPSSINPASALSRWASCRR